MLLCKGGGGGGGMGILLKINTYKPNVPLYFTPSMIIHVYIEIFVTEHYAVLAEAMINRLFFITIEKHVYVFL